MAGLFCNSPELQRLEKQMRQPPGYRARGHGSIEDMSEWKEMGAYSEIVDYVIDRMHLEYLKKRISEIFDQTEDELFFYDSDHKKRFYLLWSGSKENTLSRLPNYAATVFLLSADEKLWEKTHRQMSDTGIYFNQVRLGSVTLEQYILFHAAKDAYHGTKHIRLSELTDRELVPDEILRLIVNAFVIERYGMDIAEQKMCEEILEERNYTVLAQS